MTVASTTNLNEAACTKWDVIVIGAGPAGGLTARQAARAGLRTLLVDAKRFPRDKVCGGYLNRRALEVLHQTELSHLASDCPEGELDQLELIWGNRKSHFQLPSGRVICRTTFDAALMDSAQRAGVAILTGTSATVDRKLDSDYRRITAVCGDSRECLKARFVICADGLSRTSVRYLPELASITAADSRLGIGAVLTGDFDVCPAGKIKMVLSRYGYVGISRIQPRQFNVAAAIDRDYLLHSTPATVVSTLLAEAGIRLQVDAASANWRGTPPLTSRPRQVASERVILLGDAAGYVEPFTGEGMATALESAVAVTPLAIQATKLWSPKISNYWQTLHRQLVRDRQRTCRQLAWILRRPWASFAALSVCRVAPGIAGRIIAKTSDPSTYSMADEINSI